MSGAAPFTVADYEALAAERLDPATLGFYAGGAGDEVTLRANLAAFRRWELRPRVLVDVSGTATATTVLGTEVALPVLVAPFSLQQLAHPDGERATARAAASAGTIMCLSTLATASPAELAAAAPGAPHWFQSYWYGDSGLTRALVELAVEAGFRALVLTVDTPRMSSRDRDRRSGFAPPADMVVPSLVAATGGRRSTPPELIEMLSDTMTWRDLETLSSECPLPVVVKGVLTREDALLAVEAGAAAVVVSNHGGRQLDGVVASLDALHEVVDAVAGRCEVLLDGGVRRGVDVVKALALGARAVLVGRAALWGLAAAGEEGVAAVLRLLREELELALALCGCSSPAAVTPAHVQPAAR